MAAFSATGISLIVRKYRGTERLVTFFTRERGKVEAAARGVGRPGSKLAAAVEPFTLSSLLLAEGRSLDRLTQAEVRDSFYELRTDIARLAWASYIAELTARATEPGQPHPEVFEGLHATLDMLRSGADPQLVGAAYVLRLLCALGVAPALDGCAVCGLQPLTEPAYSPASGGMTCPGCRQPADEPLAISRGACAALSALGGLPLERLGRLRLTGPDRGQVWAVLRRHVAYHLGLRLKSEQFLAQLDTGERP